jgi:hypothetical protein
MSATLRSLFSQGNAYKILLAFLFTISLSMQASAKIIEANIDSNTTGDEGGVTVVDSPRRAGSKGFKHNVRSGGNRAEFGGDRVKVGGTYWYGWSFMHPSSPAIPSGGHTIVSQWFVGNRPASSWPCGGAGHKVGFENKNLGNILKFDFQPSVSGGGEITCKKIELAKFDQVKDKWVDIVIHAKWSANTDGFVKLWIRIGGDDGKWELKFDHKGRSQANGGQGPYFKFGAYTDTKGPRVTYSDEYRLGDESSSFEEVAPGSKSGIPPTTPPDNPPSGGGTHNLSLAAGWNLISLPVRPSNTAVSSVLSAVAGKYEAVYSYDSAQGQYLSYVPGQSGNDLTSLEEGKGYWIYMNEGGTINLSGAAAGKSISLKAGWNLAGFNSTSTVPISNALSSINGKYEAVYAFDTSSNAYSGHVPGGESDLTSMRPGEGYWIYATENVNWTLP